MAEKELDKTKAAQLLKDAAELKAEYSKRDQEFDEYERAYLCKTNVSVRGDMIKNTISPTARNKVEGAIRLLTSQQPIFRVESYSNREDQEKIDELETMLSRWWEMSGRITNNKLLKQMMESAVLYDEMHTAVTLLKDYSDNKADDKRVKRMLDLTPVLFQSWNPRYGYPSFDELGLTVYYRETEDSWANVRRKYADLLENAKQNATGNVKVGLYYDLTHYAVWIDGEPVVCEEHGLSQIPINVTIVNGSLFFQDREDQRQPLLFSLMRSKLWERENMLYTILYSQLFAIGMTPILVYKTNDQKSLALKMDNTAGFSVATLGAGDSLDILANKGILPQETQNLMTMTTDAINNSSIHNTAFGERYAGDMTFSETSLLSQAARLPLIHPQKMGGFGISSVMELALQVMRDRGISYDNNGITIKPKDIPNDLQINATLDVILPQERLQNATLAKMLVESGLVSSEWAQDNVLGITNTSRMVRKMAEEQTFRSLRDQAIQHKLQDIEMRRAQAQQQRQQDFQDVMNAGQTRQPETLPQEPVPMPEETPMTGADLERESLAQLMANAVPQVNPDAAQALGEAGLPPAMGGMIPGAGLGAAPDQMIPR